MKHLAFSVTAVGDVYELTVICLVRLNKEDLEVLAKLRRVATELDTQMKSIGRTFADLVLCSAATNWLVVDYAADDEATGKIYEKLCDSDDGVLELPEDVFDGRLRKHQELYRAPEGMGMLRTESDFMHVDEKGIYFSCAEKHCYAHHETHLVPWRTLFDET